MSSGVDPMTGHRFQESERLDVPLETHHDATRTMLRVGAGKEDPLGTAVVLAALGLIPDSFGYAALERLKLE